jgi:hexosaminidase
MNPLAKLLVISFLMLVLLKFTSAGTVNIVPIPTKVTLGEGVFSLQKDTRILIDENNKELNEIAQLLATKFEFSAGFPVKVGVYKPGSKAKNVIVLTLENPDVNLGKEGYTLDVSQKDIFVRSISANGVFYGIQSLLQLLPADFGNPELKQQSYTIQSVSIKDMPRFAYRGLHLDVGRHLFPVAFIKKYIDIMAMYKLNTFHWHLTEDQGWRIEIKKYPRLTSIGSIRKGTQIGKTDETDTVPYSGFYTQAEAREIVAYAASKFVTVIPEIEMPGHSVAALTAYPNLACTGGPFEVRTKWGVSDDICCAGNDSVFTFFQDVLTEIMDIFPSSYIHIGGDEAPKIRWEKCPKCQSRIKSEGLSNEAELQSYFIKRIEKFLISKNRHLIGWDEILEGGLAPEATVMAWRGIQAGIDAATQGHDAIMTPVDYCYFDYYQGDPATEPDANGAKLTLKTVYSYNPIPPVLSAEQAKHIIGVQGNVWTEFIKTPEAVEYKAFPRAIALSEVAWSQQENRNWDDFLNRMDYQFQRLDMAGVKYSKGSFTVDITTSRNENRNQVVLSSETKDMEIRYSIDGSDPVTNSNLYDKPFDLSKSANVKAALFKKGKMAGSINQRGISVNKASGKPVTILKPYSFKYPGTGDQAMTDGLTGTNSYKAGWQGYEGCDMEFMVDLLKTTMVSSVKLNFVKNPSDWVLFPYEVIFALSKDGKTWENLPPTQFDANSPSNRQIKAAENKIPETQARYIKVIGISPKTLPEWHDYKGEPCWIFADELIVD